MTSKLNVTLLDHSGETSTVGVRFDTLTAGNFAAENALIQAMRAAINGVSIGNERGYSLIAAQINNPVGNPADVWAQREIKWLVRCVDANGNASGFEIPCADLTLLSPNTDKLDITTAAGAALVAAIDGKARSNDGELLTFVEAVVVGRNI